MLSVYEDVCSFSEIDQHGGTRVSIYKENYGDGAMKAWFALPNSQSRYGAQREWARGESQAFYCTHDRHNQVNEFEAFRFGVGASGVRVFRPADRRGHPTPNGPFNSSMEQCWNHLL